MTATRKDISSWFDEGIKNGCTHMIIVCDTFDWDDYPVYVYPEQNARDVAQNKSNESMQTVMEVYKLDPEMKKEQLSSRRVFNYD